ncbi:MAG: acylamino-acid-releasing enzyme [Monoraphidium minutum]|nr:MAG: acylamino-acid-releasing enzyme [Monoraphidium minutum]
MRRHAARLLLLAAAAAAVLAAQDAVPAPARGAPAESAAPKPAAAAARGAPQAAAGVLEGLPPLIPLPLLLGTSKYRNAQLSPDGRYLAYNRPSEDDVYNVFVKKLPTAEAAKKLDPRDGRSLFDKDGVDGDLQVTFDARRGVTSASWGEDSKTIYYVQDADGDENYHLFQVPLADALRTGSTRAPPPVDLTPFKGVKAAGIMSSRQAPDTLYIGLNKRTPEAFDMYKLDLKTRRLTLDTVNPGGVTTWIADYDFNIRGALGYNNSDGSSYVLIKNDPPRPGRGQAPGADVGALFKLSAERNFTREEWVAASGSRSDVAGWRKLLEWPFGEKGGVYRFNKEGDALYVASSLGRDTTELQLVSASPGAEVLARVAANPLVNVGSVQFESDTWEPQMVSFNYLRANWSVLDPALAPEWERICGFRPGESAAVVDVSNDQKTWTLVYSADNTTSSHYLYRRGSWPPILLFEVQPDIKKHKLAKMNPVVIPARDGLKLPAYLTLPVKPGVPYGNLPPEIAGPMPSETGAAPLYDVSAPRRTAAGPHFATPAELAAAKAAPKGAGGRPLNMSLPLVLYVHGGPWARDSWGADGVGQWLANRGYAVLQVNFRGSEGYGKSFLNLGNRQWGVGSMQHDLTDSVKWAVAKGIADPKRVCIFGGSYGGYATLAGLAFTPDLYACGVDLVGVSNIATFMKSIPPYWKPLRYEWSTRVGDAEADAALNRRISPVFHADRIRAPLLIGQGGNDPRVPKAESDQMFSAMKARGLDVTYILYPDEGHGLARPQNRLDFYWRADHFFAKHLGGRREAAAKVEGSSAQVITKV